MFQTSILASIRINLKTLGKELSFKLAIAQPPWSGLGKKLESACRKAIYDFDLFGDQHKIAIALSGGKDSLSLLYLLHAISGRGFPKLNLLAIHIDGEFSCGAGVNKSYLEAICKKLDVPLITKTSTQKLETLACYRCSRERRSLIFNAAKEHGFHTIAFGHHADDSAQTLLMNLLHKGEFAANLPKIHMHAYNITIIRPLIYIHEKEVNTFAQQNGFHRISCQCPVGQEAMRGKVDQLLSEIEDLFPNARTNLAQAGLNYGSKKAQAN